MNCGDCKTKYSLTMLMYSAQMISLVNGPCLSRHSLIRVDRDFVLRYSARLPTNIFTSHPHNAPGTVWVLKFCSQEPSTQNFQKCGDRPAMCVIMQDVSVKENVILKLQLNLFSSRIWRLMEWELNKNYPVLRLQEGAPQNIIDFDLFTNFA